MTSIKESLLSFSLNKMTHQVTMIHMSILIHTLIRTQEVTTVTMTITMTMRKKGLFLSQICKSLKRAPT
jgi:hypothetical protein